MLGLGEVADKLKWVAINMNDHTLPKLHLLLDKLSQVIDPTSTSLIKKTEATISVIKGTSAAFFLFIIILSAVTIIFLRAYIKHRTQSFHSNYVRLQYGDSVGTIARSYANLMKFHSERVRRHGIGIYALSTNVLLIGAGETAEAYIRCDDHFSSDVIQNLLPQDHPLVFPTISDALHALDVRCTSEKKPPKTLFILLLISTRDPSRDRHEHETFQMPSSLQDHCYAIVGTGLGENGIPAHKLTKTSKGPDGEYLTKSLPLGPKNAGVCFD